ncbi:MAG: Ig-like domain-containing protein [Candidatus Andersenbacteria bacterium]
MRRFVLSLLVVLVAGFSTLGGLLPLLVPQKAQAVQAPENDDIFDVEAYNGAREDELTTRPLGEFFPPFDFNFSYNFDVDVSGGGLFGGGANADVNTDLQSILQPLFTPQEQFQKQSSRFEPPRANITLSTAGIQPGTQLSATAQPQSFKQQGSGEDLFYAWALDTVSLSGVAAGADPLDLPQASSPRATHSRATKTDSDGDGMDDDWEVRYGLNPNDPSDAGQDPDSDGYTNDVYKNESGEVLIVEPATSAGPAGGPLTNLKEYIWGTDPRNPDTDGDGFSDGQDIAGLGQTQISLTVPPDASVNDAPVLRLTILGHSLQAFEQDKPLVKLDSNTVTLTVRDAEKLDVRLEANNDAPVPGQDVTLTATLGRTDFQPGILSYTWFVNNVPQQDASGESKFTYTYTVPETAQPGDVVLFSVTAVNFETRQQAEAELEIRVGELVQLQYDPQKVESGKDLTVTATMVNNADPTDLVFHWSLDDHELDDQSGQGKTSLTVPIPKGTGEKHTVGVRVTTPEDSAAFADSQTTLEVAQPAISLVVDPTAVALGGTVTAVAVPEHFASSDLQFSWTIDSQPQQTQPSESSIVITASDSGTHTVGVRVQSVGQGAESATASASFTVATTAETALSAPAGSGGTTAPATTVASVRQAFFGRPLSLGIFFGAFFVVLGIVTALLIRRNALS